MNHQNDLNSQDHKCQRSETRSETTVPKVQGPQCDACEIETTCSAPQNYAVTPRRPASHFFSLEMCKSLQTPCFISKQQFGWSHWPLRLPKLQSMTFKRSSLFTQRAQRQISIQLSIPLKQNMFIVTLLYAVKRRSLF